MKVNYPFTVSWTNSSNVTSLQSSGWSGPVSPLNMLGPGGLPANSAWEGITLTAPGIASVNITAKNAAGVESKCYYSVTGVP